jgi:predicted GIY-YIG superfamily endonuclease
MACQLLFLTLTIVVGGALTPNLNGQATKTALSPHKSTSADDLNDIVIAAFKQTHDGWSSDEVILNDRLNDSFITACHRLKPNAAAADLNWRLLNLRKAGKLDVKATKSNRTSVSDVTLIAEIAARSMLDRHSISIDRVMTDPTRRAEFDNIVTSIDPAADLYRFRKAAFQLRKTRKLRPELITRIADWGRTINSWSLEEIASEPDLVEAHPGIYIFRDKSGYLYIGQSDDLQKRLKTHLDQSHNKSLAKYLEQQKLENITIEVHSFDPASRARETRVRRAYESELIASRKPRFNIQP